MATQTHHSGIRWPWIDFFSFQVGRQTSGMAVLGLLVFWGGCLCWFSLVCSVRLVWLCYINFGVCECLFLFGSSGWDVCFSHALTRAFKLKWVLASVSGPTCFPMFSKHHAARSAFGNLASYVLVVPCLIKNHFLVTLREFLGIFLFAGEKQNKNKTKHSSHWVLAESHPTAPPSRRKLSRTSTTFIMSRGVGVATALGMFLNRFKTGVEHGFNIKFICVFSRVLMFLLLFFLALRTSGDF